MRFDSPKKARTSSPRTSVIQIEGVAYALARPADLGETVNLVEKTGRRIVAEHGDIRDLDRLKQIVANGVAELGRIDFVLANAGIGAGNERRGRPHLRLPQHRRCPTQWRVFHHRGRDAGTLGSR
ncbi:SDR family NAD(P)-dependent oxidoreductase [Mycobacterium sp.]|uniref:SDR family NAD(P)-dependent oxidoreductase n=1 Tax=Mycobacterium sp. TaxID=1785 RepID=UPI003F94D25A